MSAKHGGSGLPGSVWIAIGLVALAGCGELPIPAVQEIKQANRAYLLARFQDSERITTAVIRAHPHKPDTAEAYYVRGLSRLKLGRRAAAATDFEAGLRRCQREALRVLLSLQLGNLAYEDGLYDRAAKSFRAAVKRLPASVPGDEVWYRYGLCLQRAGDFSAAGRAFNRVVTGYSGSPHAGDALRKMSWKHDYFTVQCGAYSKSTAAGAAAKRLRRRGLDPKVSKSDSRRDARYVVHVGRYHDHDSALAALPAVRRIQPDAFVVP